MTMPKPQKLSHLVLQTNRRDQMRDWYCTVLGAQILHENKFICFVSYDDDFSGSPLSTPVRWRRKPLPRARPRAPAAKWGCITWPSPMPGSTI